MGARGRQFESDIPDPFPRQERGQGKLPMAWFVYILRCRDDSFYTGITWNLKKRIKEHNSGKYLGYTSNRNPVRLTYWEKFMDRIKAARREKEIKGWTRLKKEKLINGLH